MSNFNSIFWKTFLIFWLASTASMLATAVIIIRSSEREHISEIHKEKALVLASRLIEQYENEGEIQRFRQWRPNEDQEELNRFNRDSKLYRRRATPIAIYDDTGKELYTNFSRRPPPFEKLQFNFVSDEDKRYSIVTLSGKPSHVGRVVKALSTLQFFLILLGSAIVSWIISWLIARPLQNLQQFSQQYKIGAQQSIDPKLLQRGDEIGALAQEFQNLLGRLEQAFNQQQRLLHDVSHELRAPLARIQVASALIEQQQPDQSDLCQRLENDCQRMDQLIQEILNLARVEGKQSIEQRVDAKAALKLLVKNAEFLSPQREIILSGFTQKHNQNDSQNKTSGLWIKANPERFNRAIENLLSNALKHSPADQAIELSLKLEAEHCLIQIRDHGEGVNDEEIEKLFQLFYRANNKMHGQGHGLGLSIVKRAVEHDNGEIKLFNHQQGGLVAQLRYSLIS